MTLVLALLMLSQAPPPTVEIIPNPLPHALTHHLELTEEQSAKIGELNHQSSTYQTQQLQKQLGLQLEIARETAKESPDPFVIGTHYVEIESINRDLTNEKKKVSGRIQELLSEGQKAKLAQLQQALATYPIACEAVNANFISFEQNRAIRDPFPGNRIPPSRIIGGSSTSTIGFRVGLPNICGSVPGFQTGDFVPGLQPPPVISVP